MRVGELVTRTVRGRPGDLAFILESDAALPGDESFLYTGWALVAPPSQLVSLGVIPPSGELSSTVTVPPIGARDSVHRFVQCFTLSPRELPAVGFGSVPVNALQLVAGTASSITILDASF